MSWQETFSRVARDGVVSSADVVKIAESRGFAPKYVAQQARRRGFIVPQMKPGPKADGSALSPHKVFLSAEDVAWVESQGQLSTVVREIVTQARTGAIQLGGEQSSRHGSRRRS